MDMFAPIVGSTYYLLQLHDTPSIVGRRDSRGKHIAPDTKPSSARAMAEMFVFCVVKGVLCRYQAAGLPACFNV